MTKYKLHISYVIPAKAGIQLIEKFPLSGTNWYCPLRGILYSWIPAFAGMTGFLSIGFELKI